MGVQWPIDNPTWSDRQGYGPAVPWDDMVQYVAAVEGDDLGWRHMGLLATLYAEHQFNAWARPMVWAPGKVHHLSTDRGVCALNSYWWRHVPDSEAFNPPLAVQKVCNWLASQAARGTRDASPWDWRPLLAWQWHMYGTSEQLLVLGQARRAVNKHRTAAGLPAV